VGCLQQQRHTQEAAHMDSRSSSCHGHLALALELARCSRGTTSCSPRHNCHHHCPLLSSAFVDATQRWLVPTSPAAMHPAQGTSSTSRRGPALQLWAAAGAHAVGPRDAPPYCSTWSGFSCPPKRALAARPCVQFTQTCRLLASATCLMPATQHLSPHTQVQHCHNAHRHIGRSQSELYRSLPPLLAHPHQLH
jgi:hypothetical protein